LATCSKKERLGKAHADALAGFAFALKRLEAERAKVTRTGYQDLVAITRDARMQCDISSEELKAHIAEHGC
jgi:hypothetical protein